VRPLQAFQITVEAPDREALLVKWLSELNYLHITQHMLYAEFKLLNWRAQGLTAEVKGEPIDPARHAVHTEIRR